MCGISGYIGSGFREITALLNNSQRHRGPDDEGFFFDDTSNLGFGHKRLSIIDLKYGSQPFYNEDGSIILIYNGEIFNADPLRRQLEGLGHEFKTTHSDTEVLLRMYEQFGIQMISKLNGMFSFAIYDKKKKKVVGARDSFGIKPFYYINNGKYFAFSSEVKALVSIPFFQKNINQQAVSHYLSFQCIPAPFTIYQGINKLPAAHYFEYDIPAKSFNIKRYWKPNFENKVSSENELLELIRIKVEESVKRWSISDVEIGSSLSGGLDSSIITVLATKNHRNLKTYTVGFEGFDNLDERSLSRQVAESCGTHHTEIIVTEKDVSRSLPAMVRSLDEPYGGGLPSWFIYKSMSKQLKVCLTGSGGDELFGNYGKWKMYATYRDYLYTIRKNFSRLDLADILKNPKGCFYYKYFTEKEKRSILNDCNGPSSSYLIQKYWYSFGSSLSKNSVASIDLQLQLPEEFLMMTDRFSMAFSMEARTPFLDLDLANFIYSLPSAIRSQDIDPKYLLRKAFADMLPKAIINNPKKGFVLPLNAWVKNFFAKDICELFDAEFLKTQGIFKTELAKKIHEYPKENYGIDKIWTLLMFQFWYKYSFQCEN